jgi:hypothetical protein
LVSVARALYGGVLVLAPHRALGVGGGALDGRLRMFAALLGARNLAEAAILSRHPTRRWTLAGATVDAAHTATMMVLAALDRRWRRVAVVSGLFAAAFTALGLTALPRSTPARHRRVRPFESGRGGDGAGG